MTKLEQDYINAKNAIEELGRYAMEYNGATGEYEFMYDCELDELKKPIQEFMWMCMGKISELEEEIKELKNNKTRC